MKKNAQTTAKQPVRAEKKTDKGVKVLHQIFRKHFYLSLVAAAVARAGAAVRAEAAEMLARAA